MLPFIGIQKQTPIHTFAFDEDNFDELAAQERKCRERVWSENPALTDVYGPITNTGMTFLEELEMRATTNGLAIDEESVNQNYDGKPQDVMADMDRCTDPVSRLELGIAYAGMHTGAESNFEAKFGRYFGSAPAE